MVYTIKIKGQSKKAKSIINMLKELQNDYDFIEVLKTPDSELEPKVKKELEKRYALFAKSKKGKEWSSLIKDL